MPRLLGAWEPWLALGVAVLMLIGLFTTAELGWPQRLESLTLDMRFRLRQTPPRTAPVAIVDIDNASIAEIGRWPWSRTVFARLVEQLAAAGAKVVAFDLLFSEPERSPVEAERKAIDAAMAPLLERLSQADKDQFKLALSDLLQSEDPDAVFAAAIQRADQGTASVIVPFVVDLRARDANERAPALPEVLERAEYTRVRGDGPDHLPQAQGLQLPIAPLQVGTLAHVTIVPDPDGAYRYDYPLLRYDDAYLPSLSLEAVRTFLGIAKMNVVVNVGEGVELGSLHVPVDEGMRLLVNYYPPGSFERIGFADALSGRVSPQTFADKIVLVGTTATGLGDVLPTPYAAAIPGIERHATLIANMLGADFIRRDVRTVMLDAVVILMSALGIGLLSYRSALAASLGAIIALAGLGLWDDVAFARFGLWLNFTFPAAAIVATFSLILGGKYAAKWRRERWIRHAFSRYLHADLVNELCRSPTALRLGGEERELTVLFADVRDFSSIAEVLSASELVSVMNEFFTAMTDVVLEHRGMLDKYIGDSLMAVFGAPVNDPHHAVNACLASIGMRSALASLHSRWSAQGRPCLEMRVGINTGPMVIGNVGTERRFDYTVMGDEVNVAARLEAANEALGTDTLISATTANAAHAHIVVVARGAIAVKGRKQKVEVFELVASADCQRKANLASIGIAGSALSPGD
jgi:adenylate cyclase